MKFFMTRGPWRLLTFLLSKCDDNMVMSSMSLYTKGSFIENGMHSYKLTLRQLHSIVFSFNSPALYSPAAAGFRQFLRWLRDPFEVRAQDCYWQPYSEGDKCGSHLCKQYPFQLRTQKLRSTCCRTKFITRSVSAMLSHARDQLSMVSSATWLKKPPEKTRVYLALGCWSPAGVYIRTMHKRLHNYYLTSKQEYTQEWYTLEHVKRRL